MNPKKILAWMGAIAALSGAAVAQQNVVQPGDAIIASSANSPGSEGVANAIDRKPTKYLNFDTRTGATGKPSGFAVTPSIGRTVVNGIALQSANDAVERDPKIITIEGSNDDALTGFGEGNWTQIVKIENIPDWPGKFGPTAAENRFKTQKFFFSNIQPFKHYRFTVLETQTPNGCCFQIAEVELLGAAAPKDVTQPGDPIIGSSANSPGSEGVANAIDGKPTKYLNFDTRTGATGKPSGFVVSPAIGRTVVSGVSLQSANDAVERDPKIITIEGSNDDALTGFGEGNWTQIVRIDNIPDWPGKFGPTAAENRFKTQEFFFANITPYKHYRFTVLETQTPNGCCFQIAEVELLGTGAPVDVTQPGDAIIASSANSPGSEGVANAIDGKPTKYLNFDTRTGATGKPSGFVVTPGIGDTTITGIALQSANDGVERDPKIITIEGSNDAAVTAFGEGNWTQIVRIDNIPDWPGKFGPTAAENRFKTQEFFFANNSPYKHYRFTVLETQTPNGCCFQIAEVELLAVTQQTDCSKARFVTQPVDTQVLSGSAATFFVALNGPWPVQWLANGQPIPGATSLKYTTQPITTENNTNTYTVEIIGCEVSSAVKPILFTPSATKSIGVSFVGGGANGTPTSMNRDDITGLIPQAYWNNLTGGTGTTPQNDADGNPIPFLDSTGVESSVTFEWASSGQWGAGTGDQSASQRSLNGLIYDNPGGEPGKLTFGNVPAGNHTVIAYLVGIPLQFQNANYSIVGQSTSTVHTRVINADEFNAAPGFFRGISTDPNNRSLASFVRFDNVQAKDGVIELTWDTLTAGFDRGAPINAVQLILNAPAAGAPPVVTVDPAPTVAPANGTASLSVTATGDGLTYQWRKNGRNLPNGGNISGATTANLKIASFAAADEGIYSVAVFNASGSALSKNASVRLSKFDIKDSLAAHFQFNETSGTTAANSASGGVAGAVTGTGTWGAGKIGNALGFDGSSTYVKVDNYTKAQRQLSGSAWVFVAAGTVDTVTIFRNAQGALGVGSGVGPGTPAGQFEVSLVVPTDGAPTLQAAIGAGPNIARAIAPTAFTLGSWQHVAFSADGAQLRLYVNGSEVAFTDYGSAINQPEIPYLTFGARLSLSTDDPPVLGPDATTPAFLSGQLDDLALWTRGLTASEVKAIFDAGNAGADLSTVKITPPVTDLGKLSIARVDGGKVKITYGGKLQSATNPAGPFTDVTGATSPFEANASDAARFYRSTAN